MALVRDSLVEPLAGACSRKPLEPAFFEDDNVSLTSGGIVLRTDCIEWFRLRWASVGDEIMANTCTLLKRELMSCDVLLLDVFES
jgi:hypothetical protein